MTKQVARQAVRPRTSKHLHHCLADLVEQEETSQLWFDDMMVSWYLLRDVDVDIRITVIKIPCTNSSSGTSAFLLVVKIKERTRGVNSGMNLSLTLHLLRRHFFCTLQAGDSTRDFRR
jgi:hypothetical protein